MKDALRSFGQSEVTLNFTMPLRPLPWSQVKLKVNSSIDHPSSNRPKYLSFRGQKASGI